MSDATEAHLLALTNQLPDDLAVPVVAFPNGAPVIIGAARHGHIGKAVDAVARHRDHCNVYVGVYAVELDRLRRLHKKGRRGGDDDVAAVVAVIADVDIAGPNHKSDKDYPHDLAEAHAVVDGVGPEPTFTLHTGGGIGAWWALADPLFIADDDDRTQARKVLDLFANGYTAAAGRVGREVDHLADLCRVMRLAGTRNHKVPPAVDVVVLDWPGHYLNDDDLAAACVAGPEPVPQSAAGTSSETQVSNGRSILDDGPNILTATINPLPWSAILTGWDRVKDTTVKGVRVERWRRPGASSAHSVVCWPDGGCKVHSDAVPGLPAGNYSKAQVVAHLAGVTVSDLAKQLWAAA